MHYLHLVTGAKLGKLADFEQLVGLFQDRLLAYARRLVRNTHDAEELVQDSFLLAWERIAGLRRIEAFPSWLFAIARRQALDCLRRRRAPAERTIELAEEGLPAPAPEWPGDPEPWASVERWNRLLAALNPAQRQVVELRYAAGFSYREIALVCGLDEGLVKSRLHEARRRLHSHLGRVPRDQTARQTARDPGAGERLRGAIMTKIDTLRLGAHVMERLSLSDQMDFARAVRDGHQLPEHLLSAIGRIDRGEEFLRLFGRNLGQAELIGILNHVDRFTETRLIDSLDQSDPGGAEWIKRQMFVFEDLVLCAPDVLALLFQEVDPDIWQIALGGADRALRDHILTGLSSELARGFREGLARVDGGAARIRLAQEAVVDAIRELDHQGRLRMIPGDESRTGQVLIDLA